MCGITGIYAKNLAGKMHMINLSNATEKIARRGPDARGVWMDEVVGLGHRRLSIIDVSENASQPMKDASGRYTIIYNGEIYNYRDIRQQLEQRGVTFRSSSDTEVLLYAYIHFGKSCLSRLNGFFAFAIYDAETRALFLARDRFGIKPLYYYHDEDKLVFASDMQSLFAFGIEKHLDTTTLFTYLQLNYAPAPHTMVEGVQMLLPGHFATMKNGDFTTEEYYHIKQTPEAMPGVAGYADQQARVVSLLEESVRSRLVADVPLGTFLSGGIDSSIISAIARRHKADLHTFSIGFRDEPFFDETAYANLVAKKLGTNHTVFSLSNDDLYAHVFDILDRMDQPFADSSAIPTYILSKLTREHVKVALSGDGADELFSGYNKHSAHLRAMSPGLFNSLMKGVGPLLNYLPTSRNGALSNKIRQAKKYSNGLRLDAKSRYWQWAGLASESQAISLLSSDQKALIFHESYQSRKADLLAPVGQGDDFNTLLLADMQLVLPNDMLRKVDMMSMANGLEVRVPFLDHRLVEYVTSLPVYAKINSRMRKRILQDAFRDVLPVELYNRPKKGFEVPLLKWFRTSLRSTITDDLLSDRLVKEQNIFDPAAIKALKKRLFSMNPGDAHAHVWAIMVFQWWWKRFF